MQKDFKLKLGGGNKMPELKSYDKTTSESSVLCISLSFAFAVTIVAVLIIGTLSL